MSYTSPVYWGFMLEGKENKPNNKKILKIFPVQRFLLSDLFRVGASSLFLNRNTSVDIKACELAPGCLKGIGIS